MAKDNAKKKNGRPTRYKKEYNEQARKLCLLGSTDKSLADFFDVSEATINNWKIQHSKFLKSMLNVTTSPECSTSCLSFHPPLFLSQMNAAPVCGG